MILNCCTSHTRASHAPRPSQRREDQKAPLETQCNSNRLRDCSSSRAVPLVRVSDRRHTSELLVFLLEGQTE